jgi:peptide/nickel transport system substrate-binding protein
VPGVGIEVELKLQEYGAYMATTVAGKYEGMTYGHFVIAREADGPLYRAYAPESPGNRSLVNNSKLTALLKAQRRTKDLETCKELIFDTQRYVAEQQYYVYTNASMITGSWQPYVKNYTPNMTFDYGSRIATLWLER